MGLAVSIFSEGFESTYVMRDKHKLETLAPYFESCFVFTQTFGLFLPNFGLFHVAIAMVTRPKLLQTSGSLS